MWQCGTRTLLSPLFHLNYLTKRICSKLTLILKVLNVYIRFGGNAGMVRTLGAGCECTGRTGTSHRRHGTAAMPGTAVEARRHGGF